MRREFIIDPDTDDFEYLQLEGRYETADDRISYAVYLEKLYDKSDYDN